MLQDFYFENYRKEANTRLNMFQVYEDGFVGDENRRRNSQNGRRNWYASNGYSCSILRFINFAYLGLTYTPIFRRVLFPGTLQSRPDPHMDDGSARVDQI